MHIVIEFIVISPLFDYLLYAFLFDSSLLLALKRVLFQMIFRVPIYFTLRM